VGPDLEGPLNNGEVAECPRLPAATALGLVGQHGNLKLIAGDACNYVAPLHVVSGKLARETNEQKQGLPVAIMRTDAERANSSIQSSVARHDAAKVRVFHAEPGVCFPTCL
jgi:hypothetical protein